VANIKPDSWTARSLTWIANQRAAMPEATADELERHCRRHYPYTDRRGWAYKAWLKAMRIYFRGIPPQRPRAKDKRCPETTDLFERDER
jgi:hypothetical protein